MINLPQMNVLVMNENINIKLIFKDFNELHQRFHEYFFIDI